MNVAARLYEHRKVVDQRIVVSADLLGQITTPVDLQVGHGEMIVRRGRQERDGTRGLCMPGCLANSHSNVMQTG